MKTITIFPLSLVKDVDVNVDTKLICDDHRKSSLAIYDRYHIF
jgi:hypothetical protein